eukprot:1114918-Alexandrium_andersonii.AAC.1
MASAALHLDAKPGSLVLQLVLCKHLGRKLLFPWFPLVLGSPPRGRGLVGKGQRDHAPQVETSVPVSSDTRALELV